MTAVTPVAERDATTTHEPSAAGKPKEMWRVPGSDHTGRIEAQPSEYERRVIAFLDRTLPERR